MTQPTTDAQPARDDLYDALDQSWYRWDPQSMAKGTGIIRLIDAHAAEVRAAVLREAADALDADMERFFTEWPDEPRNSPYVNGRKDAANELRRMAEEARS